MRSTNVVFPRHPNKMYTSGAGNVTKLFLDNLHLIGLARPSMIFCSPWGCSRHCLVFCSAYSCPYHSFCKLLMLIYFVDSVSHGLSFSLCVTHFREKWVWNTVVRIIDLQFSRFLIDTFDSVNCIPISPSLSTV